jgi:hypothetical protein
VTERDEQHLARVKANTTRKIDKKYRGGVVEHGGHLPEKPGMLAHAEAEVTDLNVYMDTLREQLYAVLLLLQDGQCGDGYKALHRILCPAEE